MDSHISEPAKSQEEPEKEPNKDVAKPKTKPKEGPKNLALGPQKSQSNLTKKPRNLALGPNKTTWKPPKKLTNLALGPQRDYSTTPKKPRNLALGPDKTPWKPSKKLTNLALGPQDMHSKPLKKPKNLALDPNRESSTQAKNHTTIKKIEPKLNNDTKIKEISEITEAEIIENKKIDHEISMDHLLEKDLQKIVSDIEKAEELRAIYAEDIFIQKSDKEAVEKYYIEKMREEGIIITNDLYFENVHNREQSTVDHTNKTRENIADLNHEKVNLEKEKKVTEMDAKNMTLTKNIKRGNIVHESLGEIKEINDSHEEIKNQEKIERGMSKSDVIDNKSTTVKEQEIEHKYSSGQKTTQILKKEKRELLNQEQHKIIDEAEEKRQVETKEISKPEVSNEINKKKIIKEVKEKQIKTYNKREVVKRPTKKMTLNHKNIKQKVEIKEIKQESIQKELGFKEEWEKTLVKWIKNAKDEDLSCEKKVELIEFLRKYRNAREEHSRLHYLNLQHKKKEITEDKKQERNYLKEKIKEYDEVDEEMFKEFHAFRCFYDYNKKRWYDTVINSKKKRYPKLVAQKLQRLKDKKIKKRQDFQYQESQVLNGNKRLSQNFKEILRENLYKITMSFEEKSKINKIIQKKSLNDDDEKKLTSILIKLPTDEFKSLLGKKFESFLKKTEFKKEKNTKKSIRIIHYNKWLTNNIKDYIENLDNRIKFLFEPYKSFIKMSSLFGLSKTYLKDQRKSGHAKKIIAVDILDRMRISLKLKIEKWIKTYPYLSDLLLKAQRDIIAFIDDYENKLNPKPTSHYRMYINHPNFIRDYFKVIDTKEKAYWLGFLFADGYITIEHTYSGDYYRMGIELSEKDRILIEKFCKTIGLNSKYIKTRVRLHSYTNKKYQLCSIRWGDQDFANDLIKHGMEYEYDDEKGKRVKIMKLPDLLNHELMVAFILGFYDGDGSLGLIKGKKRDSIYPILKSSNKEFLLEIREFFDIKSDIKSKIEEKYDFKREKFTKSKMYRLYLGIDLFREMLKIYKYSLDRKRIPLERIEEYGISPVKHWLMRVLPKEKLRQILKVLSPYKIGENLGVRVETIYSLAKDVYGIEIPNSCEQYIRIQQLINNRGESSHYFKDFNYWLKYLEKLGKFKE